MATRPSRPARADAERQARLDDDAQFAGMAAAFAQAAELGPQLLTLQQVVLGGLAHSQRREAARLGALSAPDEPRIAEVIARAERFDAFRGEVELGAQVARQFVSTFQEGGRFHGYVAHADGSAAVRYTVQLKVRDPHAKPLESGTAQTDSEGYFHIDLAAIGQGRSQAMSATERWVELFARMMPRHGTGADAADPGGGAEPGTPARTTALESSVHVLDQDGRQVFEDPVPPSFDDGMSEFRYYLLAGTGREGDEP